MPASKSIIYNLLYAAAFIFAVLFIVFTLQEDHDNAGWLLALFFAFLAIAFRSNKFFKRPFLHGNDHGCSKYCDVSAAIFQNHWRI